MFIFETFISMSLTGSVMILAVMFVRPLLKRWRTHGILLLLWISACLMLLVHFRFSSPTSVFNAVNSLPVISDAFAIGNFIGGESALMTAYYEYPQAIGFVNSAEHIRLIISGVWLTGACIALAFAVVSALLLRRRFRDAVPRTDLSAFIGRKTCVYVSSGASGPLTYGIFRPRIILPFSVDEMDSEALEYILLHEVQHIRGRHVLINLLWFLSLCLHWFNPVVWLGWFSLRDDMEISCDAQVLKRIGAERRTGYAQTLLNMVPVRQTVFPLAFGSSTAKDRIKEILAYRPATKRAICVSLAMMLCCIALFAASPAQVVMADQSLVISISTVAVGPDDTNFHLFRIHSHNSRFQATNSNSTAFTHSGAFANLSETQNYFINNHFVDAEALKTYLVPEYASSHRFGFSFGPIFSWQGLNISVETDDEIIIYMLMDASTFSSDELDLAQAISELVGRRNWSTDLLRDDCQYRLALEGGW